jgi:DNA-binding winged helix-turn-helix (wHTH) protein/predicted ATPase
MVQMTQEISTDPQAEGQSKLRFGPFCLEAAKRLWRGNQLVDLRPRSLAMLRYLAGRPSQLVTKEELLKQLWPGIYVSSTVVKVCVREIRHVLGDDAMRPQFIETVGVQGYRFIGQVVSSHYPVASRQKAGGGRQPLEAPAEHLTTPFVGREHELAQLQAWYERAQQGERQIIFVSGEAGIGKTTLVERFLVQAQARGAVRIGYGHCVEQSERGEAYLPVLQALQQLCRAPDGDQVVAILRRHAPLWLVQLSGVLEADELETVQREVQGSSPQRMLREFVEASERLAAETALILFLEDLQWSDVSTLELLEYLAQPREQARLLVIGSYRPGEAVLYTHPLRRVAQKLIGRGQCQGLELELFTEAEVETYLTQRLAGSPVVDVLWPVIHRRTEGNALFVVHFVDCLLQRGLLVWAEDRWKLQAQPATCEELIPNHVQQLLVKQIEGLSREVQQLLGMASMVGMTFTASEVAAVINHPLEATEAVYDELASQGRFIEVQGLAEWPDGSITVRYRFRHGLYQHVLYHRIGLAQRVRWHRQLGEHFAAIYGERTQEIAGELAFHFERGREYRRAFSYRQQAGEHMLRQSAYQKALGHGRAGLALLTQLPATAERGHLELKLRQIVSVALAMSRGFTDDELEDNLQQARQLCRELADEAALVPVVIGLARLHLWRANRAALGELARQEESLAERVTDRQLLVQLHTQLAWIELVRGNHACVVEHYQHVRMHHDPQARQGLLFSFVGDPLVVALGASGVSLSLTGWLDRGWSDAAQGLARTEKLHFPIPIVPSSALLYAAMVEHLRGEYDEVGRLAQKMRALGREYELPLVVTLGGLLQGGMVVQHSAPEDGVALLTTGLAQYRAAGAQLLIPYFLSFLAEGYRHQGKVAEALQAVHEALNLTATNLDVFWEAELYRQKGELTLVQSSVQSLGSSVRASLKSKVQSRESKSPSTQRPIPNTQEAEACFHQAIEIARRQEAKLLELRAMMSLARLWQQQGKKQAARQRLAEIYSWFTEGLDTKDLQEAKALLAELT